MRKRCVYLYYIMLVVICQVLVGLPVVAESEEATGLTDEQRNAIMDHCDTIKENLRFTQREDSRARVYLGRYYETILTKFVTPLNLRLVENNLSDTKLIDNQTGFAERRTRFVNDFIAYSQALEDVVGTDCKTEPEKFYERLESARTVRRVVNRDVSKMRNLVDEQVNLVKELEEKI